MVEKELATAPHHDSQSADWVRLRRQQISAGTLSFAARHLDMLARYSSPRLIQTSKDISFISKEGCIEPGGSSNQ
jgi:hypothetical protein